MWFEREYDGTAKTKLFLKVSFRVHITLRQEQMISDRRLFVCYQRRLIISRFYWTFPKWRSTSSESNYCIVPPHWSVYSSYHVFKTSRYALRDITRSNCNVVRVHVMTARRENRGKDPFILNRGTRWRWVENLTPRPLFLWEKTPELVEYEAGWTPKSVWIFWERQTSLVHATLSQILHILH